MAEQIHEPGRCAMRGSCVSERKRTVPCVDNDPAQQTLPEEERRRLVAVCGAEWADRAVCCSSEQVETLQNNFQTAYGLISNCPACQNNFRDFFCTFTCSQDQSTFLHIKDTHHDDSKDKLAVQSLDFAVTQVLGDGFYKSCKDVQFGATNSYALDFIAPGAKNYTDFLASLGKESTIGSPIQIDFPLTTPEGLTPLAITPRNCADSDLGSRCPCVHCPEVCASLPDLPIVNEPMCQIGSITCFTFILILGYALACSVYIVGLVLRKVMQKRHERRHEILGLLRDDETEHVLSPVIRTRGLVGSTSLSPFEESDHSGDHQSSESRRLGRGASLLDPMDNIQPRSHHLNAVLRRIFYRLGTFCSNHPWLLLCLTFTATGLLNLGWRQFEVETDPVRLWVSSTSSSKLEKEYFDEHFGPFFRAEQIFITPASPSTTGNTSSQVTPALDFQRLRWWIEEENKIRQLRSEPNGYTLEDVCFAPAGPGTPCVVQSVAAWFDNDPNAVDPDTWKDTIRDCAKAPTECLPDFMQPLDPPFVLGGFPPKSDSGSIDYLQSKAMVITFVVDNSLDAARIARAEEWERTMRGYLTDLSARSVAEAGAEISFSTGISLEEEINQSSNMDVRIVILSYLAMFFYISLTLGVGSPTNGGKRTFSITKPFKSLFRSKRIRLEPDTDDDEDLGGGGGFRNLLVRSRLTLGLFGMALVILSITTAVGFFSLIGVKVTLIIAEVIPFLVLAVGVDNIFILVHELDRQSLTHGPTGMPPYISNPSAPSPASDIHQRTSSAAREHIANGLSMYLPPEERVARTVSKMGPSILLSSVTQTIAFALGAIVPMPAVRNFALYAAGSVFVNAILQLTAFIAVLSLNARRTEANRVDCVPCIRVSSRIMLHESQLPPRPNWLTEFMSRYYAPALLNKVVKPIVVLLFGGLFVLSVISIQHLELGLDQRLALPSDSYLVSYFNALDEYLELGAPVYFVIREIDVTRRETQQAICAGFTTCSTYSVVNTLEAERKRTEVSYLAQPAASWIDGFFTWLNPLNEDCCRVQIKNPDVFCSEGDRRCQPCYEDKTPPWNITMDGLPEGDEFMKYLKQWLVSPANEECALGGMAAFSSAISISSNNGDTPSVSSHFRTFNVPLKSQRDFIEAYESSHRIAQDISERTHLEVFPYSYFHVFFEQYTHIIATAQQILGLGLAAILIVNSLLLGSWRTGVVVTSVVAMTVTTVMGVMAAWGIMLNAISLVNLVICLGISVEFCAHIARAFMSSRDVSPGDVPSRYGERDERVWFALTDVGPSVVSGITFTKLIGMAVLAFTRSRLLEIYYFRMWITLIVSGALHGLVFLPVILSLAGGPGYALDDEDEEWLTQVSRGHDYEYRPFRAEDDDDGHESS